MQNPFTTTFSKIPDDSYISVEQLDEIIQNFSYETPSESVYKITGVRGSGKTVLLAKIVSTLKSDEFKDKGFEILDFPCNQFKDQAPGTDAEINQFCSLKYHTTFPRYKKVEIIGENKIELYKYLESKAPFKGKGLTISMLKKLSGAKDNEVRWNFTKFLVDREGNVIDRFEPTDDMNKKVLKRVKEVVEK